MRVKNNGARTTRLPNRSKQRGAALSSSPRTFRQFLIRILPSRSRTVKLPSSFILTACSVTRFADTPSRPTYSSASTAVWGELAIGLTGLEQAHLRHQPALPLTCAAPAKFYALKNTGGTAMTRGATQELIGPSCEITSSKLWFQLKLMRPSSTPGSSNQRYSNSASSLPVSGLHGGILPLQI
ncbi:hypothetical protein EYF80_037797 [Liparis tanakae]|uniref:Uncharacterized protein n=1 Tax=Liparis tanakae TaxID=230148 RepID=A0A4Z2GFH4_9TELE|nr:hypothetical protein EYF80_037797 [Liparis tanakae]